MRLHDALCRQGFVVRVDAGSVDGSGLVRGVRDGDYMLTTQGRAWLQDLGFVSLPQPSARRRFAYPCLDWSERRDHLAGELADKLLEHSIDRGWLRRGEGRSVALTPRGHIEFLPRLEG